MNIPADLKYTPSHEWVRVEADGTLTVGITHHAQDLLGDMVFIEGPAVGRTLEKGKECAVVESVKAASDVYAPVSGEVVAANGDVEASPERVNQDAYAAWLFKIKPSDAGEMSSLLDAAGYQKLVEAEAH
ncbi:MAG: glycine cleavage system protein H [Hydrogenophilales bacterium 17-61-9]|nr:MAG: glycine cleavage system protein H [Hydrogenophilales bacterium 17-61-9]